MNAALAPLERHRKMMQKLLIVCKAFALTRDDRLDIARHICRRDNITSFNDLTTEELGRMLDAMEGATLVAHICLLRRRKHLCPNCGHEH